MHSIRLPESNAVPPQVPPHSTMHESMLSNRLVLATVETAEQLGVTRTKLLTLANFDPARLESEEGRLPASEFSRLCELVLDLSREPALGLRAGATMTGA